MTINTFSRPFKSLSASNEIVTLQVQIWKENIVFLTYRNHMCQNPVPANLLDIIMNANTFEVTCSEVILSWKHFLIILTPRPRTTSTHTRTQKHTHTLGKETSRVCKKFWNTTGGFRPNQWMQMPSPQQPQAYCCGYGCQECVELILRIWYAFSLTFPQF